MCVSLHSNTSALVCSHLPMVRRHALLGPLFSARGLRFMLMLPSRPRGFGPSPGLANCCRAFAGPPGSGKVAGKAGPSPGLRAQAGSRAFAGPSQGLRRAFAGPPGSGKVSGKAGPSPGLRAQAGSRAGPGLRRASGLRQAGSRAFAGPSPGLRGLRQGRAFAGLPGSGKVSARAANPRLRHIATVAGGLGRQAQR